SRRYGHVRSLVRNPQHHRMLPASSIRCYARTTDNGCVGKRIWRCAYCLRSPMLRRSLSNGDRRLGPGSTSCAKTGHKVCPHVGNGSQLASWFVGLAANALLLHSNADNNFTRRLKTVVPLIFAKLVLDLLPGFLACSLGQGCEHLVQTAERFSL